MNNVTLIGRLTRNPEIRGNVARFSIAINRGKNKDGEDLGADYPNIVCFGKTAELVDKYLGKGRLVGISGRVQTGKYDKDGKTVYTTDIVADRVEFLDKAVEQTQDAPAAAPVDGFAPLTDDDTPF